MKKYTDNEHETAGYVAIIIGIVLAVIIISILEICNLI